MPPDALPAPAPPLHSPLTPPLLFHDIQLIFIFPTTSPLCRRRRKEAASRPPENPPPDEGVWRHLGPQMMNRVSKWTGERSQITSLRTR
ncbi:hypothetical protein E2C01_000583 [Portunus trituberculatus]|uniref:Uncharacterized protein n=1 Tax=Portunus trituberculatus TaxID=210409 RepID=A0A5B7CGY4_PORTR|nr:hypothetical protein [Portunus trituberculatus]